MARRRSSYDELAALVERLACENAQLRQTVVESRQRVADLEEQLQAAHRQTAPFRRRESLKKVAGEKQRPGRKAGHPGGIARRRRRSIRPSTFL